ncbi:LamB/YcsF family protein [Siculibacillus lacustris]|uniref:5-oxoprolinase subunit A n=1 Tax=Siculibacillus lacustris TaxID=1549641 RepID=A0A4Q9VLA3_9HYPH|nr:5-oxoprolinase subunit PxpA [Siculibacillus lacustris]TBW35354.1 LamB/YcsF family protein [Siculibacillus lacustris]
MKTIDLNCDMGEGFGVYTLGDDEAMLDIVSSANIACGFHAGDPLVMAKTLAAAAARGVGAGAHPSFFDLWGFGRRPILGERPDDVEKQLVYQIGALQALAHAGGQKLTHVKTHGSLGNLAHEDIELARAVARAVKSVDPDFILVVMPGLETERAGEEFGLRMAREIYADRAYADNGNLASRKLPGAVLHDADEAAERILRIVETGELVTVGGRRIPVRADTVCVHGDTAGAVAMARAVRTRLEAAGYRIRPMGAAS